MYLIKSTRHFPLPNSQDLPLPPPSPGSTYVDANHTQELYMLQFEVFYLFKGKANIFQQL